MFMCLDMSMLLSVCVYVCVCEVWVELLQDCITATAATATGRTRMQR